MIRQASPSDQAAILRFLGAHQATSMFLLSNISAHGLAGSDHPHATEVYLFPSDGPIRAVIGRTRGGRLLCQAPDPSPPFAAFVAALHGSTVIGASGEAGQIAGLLATLEAQGTPKIITNHLEPLFHLRLAALSHQPRDGESLRPATPADQNLLTRWFQDYVLETGFATSPDIARRDATARADAAVAGGPLRLLCDQGRPVAMAAFNAQTRTAVQVGGVFVPPAMRNRGYGRRVTAALLAEAAMRDGVTETILFSNNDAASAAYRAIGFCQVGMYRMIEYEPFIVGGDTPCP